MWSLPDVGREDPKVLSSPTESPNEIQFSVRRPSMYVDAFSFILSNPTVMRVLG